MARRRKKSRIYWRDRGGQRRAYGDFRDFADVGGGREPLKPRGAKLATTDADIAAQLAADRVQELEERRRNKTLLGVERQAGLQEFAAHHLLQKSKSSNVTPAWLDTAEMHLRTAVGFFGESTDLQAIDPPAVSRFVQSLATTPSGRGQSCPECGEKGVSADRARDPLRWACERCREERGQEVTWQVPSLSPSTQRKYINSLSNLYRRAASEGYVPPGYNPVAGLMEKPTDGRQEASWLQVHEAALLLESARTYQPKRDDLALECLHALIATFLLTGGRKSEVLGLAVDDVSFDRRTITFRPHPWRRLKTRNSHRVVPLWPQLEEILRAHIFGGEEPPAGGLLFPSSRAESGKSKPIRELRKALDAIGERAGWAAGEIRTKMFRHTYCAARLQTLDSGAPVSPFTVAREMGHGGRSLVDRVYGHLGDVRHRSEAVEYRVEQHAEKLAGLLEGIR